MSGNRSNSVIYISSSDEKVGSEDPSLEIVKKEVAKEANKNKEDDNEVILVNSSLEDSEATLKVTKKRIKRKTKKKKDDNESAVDTIIELRMEEDIVGVADTIVTKVTEVNEVPDNTVMRKLLRGPRYFDPGEKGSSACFNCGNEGHTAFDCTMVKKKRPCFVCGKFGHNPWNCLQGLECFICNRRGHIAKNCPDKGDHAQESTLCLRCGDLGHDMLSCENDYAPGDLKEIQCYMCKNHGHFCCVDFVVDGPKVVFCYNCAQPGHMGPGCWKLHGTNNALVDAGPSALCFKCGKEGHFARECTKKFKSGKWKGRSATPRKRKGRRKKNSAVSESAPAEFGRSRKQKRRRLYHDDNSNVSTNKSRKKGSWTVDDQDSLPIKNKISNNWNSPSTPTAQRSVNVYLPNNSFTGTPISTPLTSSYHSQHQQQQYSYTPTSSYPNLQCSYNPNTSYHTQQFNYTPISYHNQHSSYTPPSSYHNQHFSYTPPSTYHSQQYSNNPTSTYRSQQYSNNPTSTYHNQFAYFPRPCYDSSRKL